MKGDYVAEGEKWGRTQGEAILQPYKKRDGTDAEGDKLCVGREYNQIYQVDISKSTSC